MSLSEVLNFDRNERWRQANVEKIAARLVPVAPAAHAP
jgi:hypothetical protein